MDIIQRNMERLIASGMDGANERMDGANERMEPMSEWKWRRLCKLTQQYGIGPWIADGVRACADDFFLNPPDCVRQQLLAMSGNKDEERLARFRLQIFREARPLNRFKRESLRVYAKDFINTIKNIEE